MREGTGSARLGLSAVDLGSHDTPSERGRVGGTKMNISTELAEKQVSALSYRWALAVAVAPEVRDGISISNLIRAFAIRTFARTGTRWRYTPISGRLH